MLQNFPREGRVGIPSKKAVDRLFLHSLYRAFSKDFLSRLFLGRLPYVCGSEVMCVQSLKKSRKTSPSNPTVLMAELISRHPPVSFFTLSTRERICITVFLLQRVQLLEWPLDNGCAVTYPSSKFLYHVCTTKSNLFVSESRRGSGDSFLFPPSWRPGEVPFLLVSTGC